MDEELDLVVFEDDAGNEITMEVLDYLAYEGKEYALLTEYVEDEDDDGDQHYDHKGRYDGNGTHGWTPARLYVEIVARAMRTCRLRGLATQSEGVARRMREEVRKGRIGKQR